MEIFILIIIIAVLAIILFLALKKMIESINADSNDYYFKKLQEYDARLAEKEDELQRLEAKPKEEKREIENKDREKVTASIDKDLLNVLNSTDYEGLNALKIANKVDEIFKIDEEGILKDFLQKVKVNPNYKVYQALEDRFSPNLIYKLKMLNREGQIKAITKMLTPEEKDVFEAYLSAHKFKLEKFLLDLDEIIENNLPNIEVIVGSHTKNYNYLSPYIKTTYSDDIYKGMIIKYQDRIYDYSINERDV